MFRSFLSKTICISTEDFTDAGCAAIIRSLAAPTCCLQFLSLQQTNAAAAAVSALSEIIESCGQHRGIKEIYLAGNNFDMKDTPRLAQALLTPHHNIKCITLPISVECALFKGCACKVTFV